MWYTQKNYQNAHFPLSMQPLGSARNLGTDKLKYCHRDKQRGETIEELGKNKP